MVCDNRFPVSHLIETFVWWLEQSLFALSQHATAAGRSSQRHAALPTYYKVVLRTEKVLLCTTKY